MAREFQFIVYLVIWLSLGLINQAAVEWEKNTQEIVPILKEQAVVAHYRFKITGDKKITFTKLHCSCGCMTVTMEKKEYAPGEISELVAILPFGQRQGPQQTGLTHLNFSVTAGPHRSQSKGFEISQRDYALQPRVGPLRAYPGE